MDFYAPLFSKIVDSSLWSEPDFVVKVYLTMLAKKDRDQIVRANAYMIGCWARKKEVEVIKALKILSEPDRRRLEPQAHDGRRIQKVPEGWLILNGKYYQDLMVTVNRRAYKAEKERERRERLANRVGPNGREIRYEQAHGAGNEAQCDTIAAEGL